MKVWKDKEGKKITGKEFWNRFKEGINNITPVQKIENEARGSFIMCLGYLVGLISLIVYRKSFVVELFTYALMLIFIGALWSNVIKWLALRTQLKVFKGIENNNEKINLDEIFSNLEEENQKAKNRVERRIK